MELRKYQSDAVNAILADLKRPGNSICIAATGAGKSVIIAEVARQLSQDVLILAPSKEITEQNLEKLLNFAPRDEIGVFSASMNEKIIKRYTFATIGSIFRKPELFGHFKLVFIDECHLLNPREEDTMFASFLEAIGSPKVIGFTASPWRLSTKYLPPHFDEMATVTKFLTRTGIWNKQTKTTKIFWKNILCNITTADLISQGYLMQPEYFNNSTLDHKDIPTNKSASDFDLEKYAELISSREDAIMDTIRRAQEVSHSVLVFCATVEQATRLSSVVRGSEIVSANTKPKDRERIVAQFKEGTVKTVFNVGCFTVGFDSPRLETVILLRPTKSIGLYLQMLGRVVRIHPDKRVARIIDFTGTLKSLGRIENIFAGKIDGKWNIIANGKSWHDRELYRFTLR